MMMERRELSPMDLRCRVGALSVFVPRACVALAFPFTSLSRSRLN